MGHADATSARVRGRAAPRRARRWRVRLGPRRRQPAACTARAHKDPTADRARRGRLVVRGQPCGRARRSRRGDRRRDWRVRRRRSGGVGVCGCGPRRCGFRGTLVWAGGKTVDAWVCDGAEALLVELTAALAGQCALCSIAIVSGGAETEVRGREATRRAQRWRFRVGPRHHRPARSQRASTQARCG